MLSSNWFLFGIMTETENIEWPYISGSLKKEFSQHCLQVGIKKIFHLYLKLVRCLTNLQVFLEKLRDFLRNCKSLKETCS